MNNHILTLQIEKLKRMTSIADAILFKNAHLIENFILFYFNYSGKL